jgi:hypothetical protein
MRTVTKWIMAATISAGAVACVGIGAAAAADVPVPYGQPRQAPPPGYYPPEQGYVYRQPPPAYVYPAPPPVYYEAPVVAVVPPVYEPYYYGPRYYGPRYYDRRAGYEYYDRPWRRRHW